MITRRSNNWKFSIIFLSLFITSCIMFKSEKTFSKNGLEVTFRSLKALDGVENIKFRYPIILSEKQVLNHLLSLWHQRIVSPDKPRPLFSYEEAATLAPLLKMALIKVAPTKFLNFEFQSSKGVIEGRVFATAKKLHWHFLKIHNEVFSNDPLRIRTPTWQLVRKPGQTYQKIKSGSFSKILKNRIIANINLPLSNQRSQSRPRTRPSTKNPIQSESEKLTLKSKLDALKKFLDVGIIDKIEYEKKKASLMKKYFKVHD